MDQQIPYVCLVHDNVLDGTCPFRKKSSIAEVFRDILEPLWNPVLAPLQICAYEPKAGDLHGKAPAQLASDAVGIIALLGVDGDHSGVRNPLTMFKQRPEFAFETASDQMFRRRICLIGVHTQEPLEFEGESLALDTPTFGRSILNSAHEPDYKKVAEEIVKKFGLRLPKASKRKRIVLGIGAPDYTENFRSQLKKEIEDQRPEIEKAGFEIVDVKFRNQSSQEAGRQLRSAMNGASLAVHFLSPKLSARCSGTEEHFLDLQIGIAEELGLPQKFCVAPPVPKPEETPTSNFRAAISTRYKRYETVRGCFQDLLDALELQKAKGKLIYLIGNGPKDKRALDKIQVYLQEQRNFKLVSDAADSRFVLSYWGQGSRKWHEGAWAFVGDAKIASQQENIEVAGIYFGAQRERDKEEVAATGKEELLRDITIEDYEPILSWDDFNEAALEPFLKKVLDRI